MLTDIFAYRYLDHPIRQAYIEVEQRLLNQAFGSRSIRELRRLNRIYGKTTWRKRKGIAKIRLEDGTVTLAELHWYEGHGKGRKETKIKKYLE
jgi:hypothetical protein